MRAELFEFLLSRGDFGGRRAVKEFLRPFEPARLLVMYDDMQKQKAISLKASQSHSEPLKSNRVSSMPPTEPAPVSVPLRRSKVIKDKTVSFKLDGDLFKLLTSLAESEERPVSEVVRLAVKSYLAASMKA